MTKTPDPTDMHVGKRLKERRQQIGVSQGKLGDALGISFQQIQKYERGYNRMSGGRLQQAADFLDVPVSYFFVTSDPADRLFEIYHALPEKEQTYLLLFAEVLATELKTIS